MIKSRVDLITCRRPNRAVASGPLASLSGGSANLSSEGKKGMRREMEKRYRNEERRSGLSAGGMEREVEEEEEEEEVKGEHIEQTDWTETCRERKRRRRKEI